MDEFTGQISDFTIYGSQLSYDQITRLGGAEADDSRGGPEVIKHLLAGTFGDDARDYGLDAGQHRVDLVFRDFGDELLIPNSPIASSDRSVTSPSSAIDPSRIAKVGDGGHGKDTWIGSDPNDLLIRRGEGSPTAEHRRLK